MIRHTFQHHIFVSLTGGLSAAAFVLALTFAPDTATAQTRRVTHRLVQASTPTMGASETRIEVHEQDYVDQRPQFPGGEVEMYRFINTARRYPADAYRRRVQGRVLCDFIVGTDGKITNIRVIKGVEESLNREAVRIISEMPRWDAGRVGNEPVPVHCILPIAFRL